MRSRGKWSLRHGFGIALLAMQGLGASAGASQDMGARIDAIRRQHDVPAASYFIVDNSTVLASGAFGQPSRDSDRPMTLDVPVRIGSISKTLTALAVLRLVEQGRIALDTRLAALVADPAIDNPWRGSRSVTIGHLLEHTAGLSDLSPREFAFNKPVTIGAALAVDPTSRRLQWPPGMHASYSNSGAGLVAHAIESVTGATYETVVRDEVFLPLGLDAATFSPMADSADTPLQGYARDGHTPIPYWHTLYRAFGGANIPTIEVVPLVQMLLNRGRHNGRRFLTEASIDRLETPRTSLAARDGLRDGYGLGVYHFERLGVPFTGHDGDADGHLAFLGYSTTINRGYFIAINAFNKPALTAMRKVLEEAVSAGFAPPPAPRTILPVRHLAELTGTYTSVTRRFRGAPATSIEVQVRDGQLYTMSQGSAPRPLVAVRDGHFRRSDEHQATIAFVRCSEAIYLQGDFGNFMRRPGAHAAPACAPTPDQALSTQRTPVPPRPQ